MERVTDDWLNEAIPKYSAIDSKSKGANVYLALYELRERRQMENEQGELVVVSTLLQLLKKAEAGTLPSENAKETVLPAPVKQVDGKAEKEQGNTDNSASEKDGAVATQEKQVLPIPCTKGFEGWTVKDYFQKINEELDEMKEVVLRWGYMNSRVNSDFLGWDDDIDLAEEAADTITAITSMLEAMGIDEQQRQAAQRRVNEHNRERNML